MWYRGWSNERDSSDGLEECRGAKTWRYAFSTPSELHAGVDVWQSKSKGAIQELLASEGVQRLVFETGQERERGCQASGHFPLRTWRLTDLSARLIYWRKEIQRYHRYHLPRIIARPPSSDS